mmetsp:Transcript_2682/g.12117  ORF Transcript_2682/g.12117 Transcript_2682/m.12117 type:complete len:233 (-) Transcript_2682:399-1097(-)
MVGEGAAGTLGAPYDGAALPPRGRLIAVFIADGARPRGPGLGSWLTLRRRRFQRRGPGGFASRRRFLAPDLRGCLAKRDGFRAQKESGVDWFTFEVLFFEIFFIFFIVCRARRVCIVVVVSVNGRMRRGRRECLVGNLRAVPRRGRAMRVERRHRRRLLRGTLVFVFSCEEISRRTCRGRASVHRAGRRFGRRRRGPPRDAVAPRARLLLPPQPLRERADGRSGRRVQSPHR